MIRLLVPMLAVWVLGSCAGTEDCDPDLDGDQALVPLYADADADGFSVAASELVCMGDTVPDGYVDTATEPDCDDSSAAVFPGAPDHELPAGFEHHLAAPGSGGARHVDQVRPGEDLVAG